MDSEKNHLGGAGKEGTNPDQLKKGTQDEQGNLFSGN